jgi:hypothetical protein
MLREKEEYTMSVSATESIMAASQAAAEGKLAQNNRQIAQNGNTGAVVKQSANVAERDILKKSQSISKEAYSIQISLDQSPFPKARAASPQSAPMQAYMRMQQSV